MRTAFKVALVAGVGAALCFATADVGKAIKTRTERAMARRDGSVINLPGLSIQTDGSESASVRLPGLSIEADESGATSVTMPGLSIETSESGQARVFMNGKELNPESLRNLGFSGGRGIDGLRNNAFFGARDRVIYERDYTFPLSGSDTLDIRAEACDLVILRDPSLKEVEAHLVVKASKDYDKFKGKEPTVSASREGSTLVLNVLPKRTDGEAPYAILKVFVPDGFAALRVGSGLGDVEILDTTSTLDVRTELGDVRLEPKTLGKGIIVEASLGEVYLDLPDGAAFILNAKTELGTYHGLFEEEGDGDEDDEGSARSLKRGSGGVDIQLTLELGDITVEE